MSDQDPIANPLFSEPQPKPAAEPATGTATFYTRLAELENTLREANKSRREAESKLASKDMEFEVERHKLNVEISIAKAETLRFKSEVDDLRHEIDTREDPTYKIIELESKLTESENVSVKLKAVIGRISADLAELREKYATATAQNAYLMESAGVIRNKIAEAVNEFDTKIASVAELPPVSDTPETAPVEFAAETPAVSIPSAPEPAPPPPPAPVEEAPAPVEEAPAQTVETNDVSGGFGEAAPPAPAESPAQKTKLTQLSAIEKQLQREISALESSARKDAKAQEDFRSVFKRRQ